MQQLEENEGRLRESESSFGLATQVVSDGLFDWNLENDEVVYSDRFLSLLGFEREEFGTSLESFRTRLHPEDRSRVLKEIHTFLKEQTEFSSVYSIQTKKGDYRWFFVGASVGIALYPEDGLDAETLVRNADTAMYHAKELSRGTVAFYSESMNAEGVERLVIESGLRRAIGENQFRMVYQPQRNARTAELSGCEALLRWEHNGKPIGPDRFVPIAEDTGLIVPIGD